LHNPEQKNEFLSFKTNLFCNISPFTPVKPIITLA